MSLISDISSLTTIPVSSLEKLVEKEQLCILHKFYENEKNGEMITHADIGIGSIYIKHEGNDVKYKFIPTKMFENEIIKITQTNTSPLISKVEDTLRDRVLNTYKDLF